MKRSILACVFTTLLLLASSDTIGQSPTLVADILTGSISSSPAEMAEYNNKMYFSAYGGSVTNTELFVYNGTNAPTLVSNINPGTGGGSYPRELTVFNGKLYFVANGGPSFGEEIHYYNGVSVGRDFEMVPGPNSFSITPPKALKVFNNKLYFNGNNGVSGSEMWVYDGINPPTLVADIVPGTNGSDPYQFTVFNNKLYFVASTPSAGYELWVYDGINPPSMVYDLLTGSNGSWPEYLTVFNNKLYFSASSNTETELWVYDGVTAPTMVYDINPGINNSSSPMHLKVYNNKLYFLANTPALGDELWSYSGSGIPSNVADINPGSANALTDAFYVANNKLFFTANNGTHGFELWWYDGTNSPTLVGDIYTGSNSSSPKNFFKYKGKLYFSAINTGIGRELWSLCLQTSGTDVISACHSYTWINGNTYTSNNNTATHTLTNSVGCDSIVTLNLTIKPKTYKTITTSACTNYTLNAQTYTTSGVYTQTLTNTFGCDSIITLNLTIKPKTYKTITTSACTNYTLNAQTYTTSGIYTQTLTNTFGCDSIITLNLTINTINTSVSVFGQTIVSNELGATYQWIACSNNSVAIIGATSNSYTPSNSGSYAVILLKNGCTDTSSCITINTTLVKEHDALKDLLIHPNPSIDGVFNITGITEHSQIYIYNELGEILFSGNTDHKDSKRIDLSNEANGVYYIKFITHEAHRTIKIVKLEN